MKSNVNQAAGSVRPANGKWVGSIVVGEGRGAPKRTKTFTTRKEANAWLAEMKSTGVPTGGLAEMTVAEAFDSYVASNELRPKSIASFGSARKQALAHGIGSVKVKDLKPSQQRAFTAWMAQQPSLGSTSVNLYANKLNSVLRFAAADGALTFTPKAPTVKVVRVAKTAAITSDEVRALYDAAPETFAPAIIFGAFAGMRSSEAAAVTVADIDFMKSTVTVNKAIQPDGSFGPTKTPRSMRTIPLTPAAIALLGVHCKDKLPDALVATNVYGRPMTSTSMAATFRKITAAVGVDISFHSLRKFFATTLMGAGVNVVSVAKYIGDTVEELLKTYALTLPGDDDKARDAIGAVFEAEVAA